MRYTTATRRQLLNKKYIRNKEKTAIYNKSYKLKNKEKIAAWTRDYLLKATFNITVEEYNKKLANQNENCDICKKHYSLFKRNLSVDHCHSTGRIRGLLCSNCNVALGHMKESPDNITNMLSYLAKWSTYENCAFTNPTFI